MSIGEKLAVLGFLILTVFAVWIIYELKTAPTVGDDYARKIEKTENQASKS